MEQDDLQPIPERRWSNLQVPNGWGPIAELCLRQREQLHDRVRSALGAIRAAVPAYSGSPVPPEDLAASIECNLEALLLGVAERRPPTPGEIEQRSMLGRRRANQDVPIDALLQAYHVGYRDLWRRFLLDADAESAAMLPEVATTLWEWTHRVTDGIGKAHAEATRQLAARTAGARHRFLELLLGGGHHSDEAGTLSRSLGFDPDGSFQGTVVCEFAPEGTLIPRLRADLGRFGGVHQAIPHGPRLVVVSQAHDQDAIEAALTDRFPASVIGVGLARTGLPGAHLSVGDAELAADAADAAGVHTFAETWPWAVLARERERLEPLLATARDVAAEQESFATTVELFGASGFSITATARKLHIHPNTVSYRLDRWQELTGWNPRHFAGLLHSMAALNVPE